MNRSIKCRTLCTIVFNILVSAVFNTSFEALLNKEVLKSVNDRGGRLIFTYPGDDKKVVFVVYHADKVDVVDENEMKTVEYKIHVNTFLLRLEQVQEINKVIGDMFKAKNKTKEILKYFTNKNFSILECYVLTHDPFSPNEEVSPVAKGKDAKKESVRFKLNYSRKDFFPEVSPENAKNEIPQLKEINDEEHKDEEENQNVKDVKKTVLEITFSFTPDLKKNSVSLESTDPEDLEFHYRSIKKKNVVNYYKKKSFLFKFLGTNNPENAPNAENKPLIKLIQGEGGDTEIKDGDVEVEGDRDGEDDEDDDDEEKKSEVNKSKTDNDGKQKTQAPDKKKAESTKKNKDKNIITILVIVLVVLAFLVFLLAIVKIYMTSQEHKKMSAKNHDKIEANEKQVDI